MKFPGRTLFVLAALVGPAVAAQDGTLTLESLFHPDHRGEVTLPASAFYTWQPGGKVQEVRYEKGQARRHTLDPLTWTALPAGTENEGLLKALKEAGADEAKVRSALEAGTVAWNPGRTAALVTVGPNLYQVGARAGKASKLGPRDGFPDAELSPDGHKIVFRKDHDLWIWSSETRASVPLTTGGTATALNGELDWVYEEEVYGRGTRKAFWWAPDSAHVAFLHLDTAQEPIVRLMDERSNPQKPNPYAYPKAGEPNPVARLGLADLKGSVTWMENPDGNPENLIVQVGFDPKGHLLAAWQNRIQSWFDLRVYEGTHGRRLIFEESKAWIERLPLPSYLKDGGFLWESDRSGHHHVYRYDASGNCLGALTAGTWEVRAIHGADEKAGLLYFDANERNPAGTDLYSVKLSGRIPNEGMKRLTEELGSHSVSFSRDFSHFLDRWSSHKTPGATLLKEASGRTLRVVEDRRGWKLPFRAGETRMVQVPTRDGFMMDAQVVLPTPFDPARKYPVFQSIYGGPNMPSVHDAWSMNGWAHFLAQHGYVVWTCDNRSGANKGNVNTHKIYGRLGTLELQDQLDGLQWLKAQGWADMSRVCMEGWSFGGFMAANAITKGGGAWKLSIIGAPVTDYHLYDSIYTERYMGLPRDNPQGYASTRVMDAVPSMRGRCLLFHGLMDDNVHLQNSVMLLDALQASGKDYDLVFFPGAGHGPRGAWQNWNRYKAMWKFIQENL